jgi:hypothetical protein
VNKLEITSPSNSNHSRDGTLGRKCWILLKNSGQGGTSRNPPPHGTPRVGRQDRSQSLQAIIDIKKSWLTPRANISEPPTPMESETNQIGEFLEAFR